jgi:hypothetical protein
VNADTTEDGDMAVLCFARETTESTTGFAAYDLPLDAIAAKLGGEGNFKFLSPLHRPPITSLGRSGQAVDYRFVVVELDVTEAEAANWRAGFYKLALSSAEVLKKLGQPNTSLEAENEVSATHTPKGR